MVRASILRSEIRESRVCSKVLTPNKKRCDAEFLADLIIHSRILVITHSFISAQKNTEVLTIDILTTMHFLQVTIDIFCRSSHAQVFCRKGVLKMFAKFMGKYLKRGLFLIMLRICKFIKNTPMQVFFSWSSRCRNFSDLTCRTEYN